MKSGILHRFSTAYPTATPQHLTINSPYRILLVSMVLLLLPVAVKGGWGTCTSSTCVGYGFSSQGQALSAWLNGWVDYRPAGGCGSTGEYRSCPVVNELSGAPGVVDVPLICSNGISPDGTCPEPYEKPNKSNGDSCGAGSPMAGNPINTANGNKTQREVDYRGGGPFPLVFARTYNTNTLPFGELPVGVNWVSSVHRRFFRYAISNPNDIDLELSDGKVYSFRQVNGQWQADPDVVVGLTAITVNGVLDGWRVQHPDDSVETFTLDGQLSSITNREGHTHTYSYNVEGQLIAIDDGLGRQLTFTYNADNHVATMTDPDGGVYRYSYDPTGHLIAVTYPDNTPANPADNPKRQYHYSDPRFIHGLTGITDAKGNPYASWTYDDDGRALSSSHAGGTDQTTFVYNADGSATTANALGKQTTYHFELLHGVYKVTQVEGHATASCAAANINTTFDANGFVASTTDWNGNTTSYVRSATGLELSRTEAVGTPAARTITTEWHSTLRVPVKITEPVRETYFTYDAVGRLLVRRVASVTLPVKEQVWTYTYNALGLVETLDGPRTDINDVSTYTYDGQGNLSTLTNPLMQVTRYRDYNGRGQPGTVVDINGVVTRLSYHPRGWLLSSTVEDPGGDPVQHAVTHYQYDAVGQVTGVILPGGNTLTFEYDAAQRLVAMESMAGERVEYTLDAAGNITTEITKNSSGIIRKSLTRVYDELSRLRQLTGAANQTMTYNYDPNSNNTQVVDGRTNPTSNNFDALNRLESVTEATNFSIGYTRDAQDRLTAVSDQRGLTTHYTYDAFDNLTQVASPDTGATVYTHDDAGNPVFATDARNVVTAYSHDALNRVTGVSFPASPGENITYGYDSTADGNYGKGRLTQITDESGQTLLAYDHRGNLVQKTYTVEGVSYGIHYAYDLANNLVQITYPSGRLVNYSVDTQNRVTGITTREYAGDRALVVVSDATYLPFGPLQSYTFGNGVTRTVTYDQDYRQVAITVAGAQSVLDRNYVYDSNNNITEINRLGSPGASQHFTYDSVDRLTDATGGYGQQTFQYDGVGNRTQHTQHQAGVLATETLTYGVNSNRLTQTDTDIGGVVSQRQFQYDGAGNRIQETAGDTLDLAYNDNNRYQQLDKNGALTAVYLYNALGQRVSKISSDPALARHYHYDESGLLLAESDMAGVRKRDIIYLNGIPVASLEPTFGVTIDSPGDGTIFGMTTGIALAASASDHDGSDLSAAVSWQSSLDGSLGTGANLIVNLTSGDHTLTASLVNAASETATAVVTVTVNEMPPIVTITAPSSGASFALGDTVQLVAMASDAEDGDISAAIQWQSSIEGSVGTGATVNTVLGAGIHKLTASVVDSGGKSGSAEITVLVIDPRDTDVDGMPDDWEIRNFGNLDQTASEDFDGDLLTNLQEYLFGSNPLVDGEFNTLDPANTHSSITLSNGDTTATTAIQSWISSFAVDPLKPGRKYYWELAIDYVYDRAQVMLGIASDPNISVSSYIGRTTNSYSWGFGLGGVTLHAEASTSFIPFGIGDRLMVAFDPDAGKLWFGKNGVWQGDPVAGTGERFNGITGLQYAGVSVFNHGQLTVAFDNSRFLYTPPAGFVAPVIDDGDSDGLKDSWEYRYFSGLDQNATGDPDNDGLRNEVEQALGTDPTDGVSDTDADGLPDGWEYDYFENLDQNATTDFDGDQLTNLQEYQFGSNPLVDGEFNTLDPASTHSSITLSNGDTTATTAIPYWISSFAVDPLKPGKKYYWELAIDYVYDRAQVMLGIASDPNITVSSYIGRTTNSYSWGFGLGGATLHAEVPTSFIPFGTGDRLMVAFDPDAGKLWFGKNGVWQGDPVAGTGERFNGITGLQYAGVSVYNHGQVTVAFDTSRFSYTPPVGFVAPVIDDGDSDGLKDTWEYRYFSGLGQDAAGDPDSDGLQNGAEQVLGTDPTDGVTDTDADGLPDSWEYSYFRDLDQNATTNFDGDHMSDLEEYQAGTDPTVVDADNIQGGPTTPAVRHLGIDSSDFQYSAPVGFVAAEESS